MNDDVIEQLRKEANDVKSCFTTFAFQAIALSGVVLGAVTRYQPDEPTVGLAGILVMMVVLTVSQIGNYKYGTANRHFAFQLYCETLKTRNEPPPAIGWEEAILAWRVVQTTIFDAIYYSRTNTRWYQRWRYDKIKEEPAEVQSGTSTHWFNMVQRIHGLTANGRADSVTWYAGHYLRTMQGILHIIAAASLVPMVFMAIQFQFDQRYQKPLNPEVVLGLRSFCVAAIVVFVVTTALLILKTRQIRIRRGLLESGLLSIGSSATVWEAVVNAHARAIDLTRSNQCDYLMNLGDVASVIGKHATHLSGWLKDPSNFARPGKPHGRVRREESKRK